MDTIDYKMNVESLVSKTPLIVEKIFKSLPAIDLCRFTCVNELWQNLSTAELNRRREIVNFFQGFQMQGSRNAGIFEDEFDRLIRELQIKPAYCIAFMTATLYENFEKFFPSHPIYEPKKKRPNQEGRGISRRQEHLESVINTAFKKRLPKNCQVGLYVGSGIVGTVTNSEKIVDLFTPAISGYFFPERPQQGIQFCRMRNFDCKPFRRVAAEIDLKSALVLVEYRTLEYFDTNLREIWNDFSEKGILYPVNVGSDVSPLFFGTNVRTALFKTPFTEEERGTLEDLENRNFFKPGTIAFVFADYAKAFRSFLEIFHKRYPFIPIAGFNDKSHYYSDKQVPHNCRWLIVSIDY